VTPPPGDVDRIEWRNARSTRARRSALTRAEQSTASRLRGDFADAAEAARRGARRRPLTAEERAALAKGKPIAEAPRRAPRQDLCTPHSERSSPTRTRRGRTGTLGARRGALGDGLPLGEGGTLLGGPSGLDVERATLQLRASRNRHAA